MGASGASERCSSGGGRGAHAGRADISSCSRAGRRAGSAGKGGVDPRTACRLAGRPPRSQIAMDRDSRAATHALLCHQMTIPHRRVMVVGLSFPLVENPVRGILVLARLVGVAPHTPRTTQAAFLLPSQDETPALRRVALHAPGLGWEAAAVPERQLDRHHARGVTTPHPRATKAPSCPQQFATPRCTSPESVIIVVLPLASPLRPSASGKSPLESSH